MSTFTARHFVGKPKRDSKGRFLPPQFQSVNPMTKLRSCTMCNEEHRPIWSALYPKLRDYDSTEYPGFYNGQLRLSEGIDPEDSSEDDQGTDEDYDDYRERRKRMPPRKKRNLLRQKPLLYPWASFNPAFKGLITPLALNDKPPLRVQRLKEYETREKARREAIKNHNKDGYYTGKPGGPPPLTPAYWALNPYRSPLDSGVEGMEYLPGDTIPVRPTRTEEEVEALVEAVGKREARKIRLSNRAILKTEKKEERRKRKKMSMWREAKEEEADGESVPMKKVKVQEGKDNRGHVNNDTDLVNADGEDPQEECSLGSVLVEVDDEEHPGECSLESVFVATSPVEQKEEDQDKHQRVVGEADKETDADAEDSESDEEENSDTESDKELDAADADSDLDFEEENAYYCMSRKERKKVLPPAIAKILSMPKRRVVVDDPEDIFMRDLDRMVNREKARQKKYNDAKRAEREKTQTPEQLMDENAMIRMQSQKKRAKAWAEAKRDKKRLREQEIRCVRETFRKRPSLIGRCSLPPQITLADVTGEIDMSLVDD
ncbi:hypothetical protein BJ684DRAFT_21424 [Piptocephalis cylindrospora]|uniref:Uncharacterized protein n=1 Tax=Piptocephalis cylindrospora TaxID=1907219 RepID=A0A4P9XZY9_9FUNG|nr:hypothetical protein BJ684DRAFT_21424 [Piptocephalis cylindrospora]|eukprot:RKP12007.1 hypothetical protein BJ684DRAFT_21424 [Piptocephalis cylindrospora]